MLLIKNGNKKEKGITFIMANNDGVGPGGKGHRQRPTDKKKFDENFDRIFGKKQKNTEKKV